MLGVLDQRDCSEGERSGLFLNMFSKQLQHDLLIGCEVLGKSGKSEVQMRM
jgi:hypothetical protein